MEAGVAMYEASNVKATGSTSSATISSSSPPARAPPPPKGARRHIAAAWRKVMLRGVSIVESTDLLEGRARFFLTIENRGAYASLNMSRLILGEVWTFFCFVKIKSGLR